MEKTVDPTATGIEARWTSEFDPPPKGLTTTERKMRTRLADGRAHSARALHRCLHNEQGRLSNIRPHMCSLRRKLAAVGQTVLCYRRVNETWYQLVFESFLSGEKAAKGNGESVPNAAGDS